MYRYLQISINVCIMFQKDVLRSDKGFYPWQGDWVVQAHGLNCMFGTFSTNKLLGLYNYKIKTKIHPYFIKREKKCLSMPGLPGMLLHINSHLFQPRKFCHCRWKLLLKGKYYQWEENTKDLEATAFHHTYCHSELRYLLF